MPYVFSTNYQFIENIYQIDVEDAVVKFPFLEDKTVIGEVLATYVEKVTLMRKPFKCKLVPQEGRPRWRGIITDPNPLKEEGIPPCQVCVVLYKYEETLDEKTIELPVMENQLIKGSTWGYFDEIIKKISKEEEIRIMIETTTFHLQVIGLAATLRDAYISFEEERYPHTKTSCRKVLENLRNKIKDWKTIDSSDSLCDKFKSVSNSLYALASSGGPHEGINTKEETEFILKAVAGMLFYVNNLLKSQRVSQMSDQSK